VLAAFAALLTIAQIPHDLGANRRLPEILPPAQLVPGNTRLSLGDTIARQLIAPPIGGLLFAVSAVLPLGIDAATFGLAAAVLAFPTARRERSPVARPTRAHREVVSGLRTGLGVVRRCTTLRAQAAVLVVWNLVLGGIFGILVLWATRTLGLSSAEYGLLALGSAVGGLLGALAASAIRRRIGSGRALQLSVVGLMTTLVGMGLTVDPVLAGALFALNGAASVIWNIVVVSLRQSIVPAELLDRVQGVFLTCSRGVQFVGTLLGGVVAAAWGLRAPLLLAAAGLLVLVPFLPALSDRHAVLAERQLRQEVG
jgi:Na+/melibiose symporter-like transporter